jgi:hypothetical protein
VLTGNDGTWTAFSNDPLWLRSDHITLQSNWDDLQFDDDICTLR